MNKHTMGQRPVASIGDMGSTLNTAHKPGSNQIQDSAKPIPVMNQINPALPNMMKAEGI